MDKNISSLRGVTLFKELWTRDEYYLGKENNDIKATDSFTIIFVIVDDIYKEVFSRANSRYNGNAYYNTLLYYFSQRNFISN